MAVMVVVAVVVMGVMSVVVAVVATMPSAGKGVTGGRKRHRCERNGGERNGEDLP
jgi:hypothetical protein